MPGSDAIVSCIRNLFSRDLPEFMIRSVGSCRPSSVPIHSTKLSKASLTYSLSCCQHWYAHRRSKTTPEAPSFHTREGHVVTSNAQKLRSSSIGNWALGVRGVSAGGNWRGKAWKIGSTFGRARACKRELRLAHVLGQPPANQDTSLMRISEVNPSCKASVAGACWHRLAPGFCSG
ncbi:hypothetical protein TcBrA4_0033060 [Trypanosoma cruzi]|nr:hypothetical protein TcBrA4_0033060 [Trypanosoma cruzi]